VTDPPVVVVTGAGGQIGTAIARAIAARDARVVLVDRDPTSLGRAAQALGGDPQTVQLDVTDPEAAPRLVAHVLGSAGRLDAVVNNAGIEGPVGRIDEIPLSAVRTVFDVNVFGLLAVIQAVLPHFRRQRSGRIVNIASGAGLAGSGHMTPYSASKHAVVGITRSVAAEAGPDGIAVNAVCPGCVDSPMMERIEEQLTALTGKAVSFVPSVPMGRYARPDEVADLVAYLALEAPVYMTGAALVIDGGLRA